MSVLGESAAPGVSLELGIVKVTGQSRMSVMLDLASGDEFVESLGGRSHSREGLGEHHHRQTFIFKFLSGVQPEEFVPSDFAHQIITASLANSILDLAAWYTPIISGGARWLLPQAEHANLRR